MTSWIGANVWVMCKKPDDVWTQGKVVNVTASNGTGDWVFEIESEDRPKYSISTSPIDSFNLEFEWVKRREVESIDYVKISDMTALTYLNEPEIIECLRQRFLKDLLYTSTGPILVAVNPYKYLSIYAEDTLELYFEEGSERGSPSYALPPHIFQISDNAYRRMLVDKFNPDKRENQSILVNGESGAGKTESTKHCLHYLAVVSSKVASCLGMDSDSGDIENKIIASNPITESLGNAKTSRNNNSSRFGKYIELGYSSDGVIETAGIRTYLLETVRVVSHVEGERNFHIFYEIAAALPQQDLDDMGFTSIHDFKYLQNGNKAEDESPEEREMDIENYSMFRDALDTMDIPIGAQDSLICVAVAILHIGNLTFSESNVAGEEAAFFSEEAEQHHVKYICQLLGISEIGLLNAVGRRSISIAGSTTIKQLSVQDAMHAKDILARTIYNYLFTWMLASVNESLATLAEQEVVSHIGILDIFGFEFFETNSFEQLCINYTNEKLQDHFNNSIFRTEQELYRSEGIQWIFVDYPDNSSRLDLLENKRNGIFAQCDERLKLKAAVSHEVLAKDLYLKCSASPFFFAEASHKRKHQFIMKHFAGDVLYNTEYFLEKNRSEVAPELSNCLKDSRSIFVRQLAEASEIASMEDVMLNSRTPSMRGASSPLKAMQSDGALSERRLSPRKKATGGFFSTPQKTAGAGPGVTFQEDSLVSNHHRDDSTRQLSPAYSRAASTGMGSATRGALKVGLSPKLAPLRRKRLHTVLSQFTKQLQELMDSIKTTRSHFVRCIKPNSLMTPDAYDPRLVMSQLRCGGVLGAVQVFRAGFPNRFDFSYFVTKYSSFAFVCGQNESTKDFYNLRDRAVSTEHESYWQASCDALMKIVPMAETILTLLGIRATAGASNGIPDDESFDVVDVSSVIHSASLCGSETTSLIAEGMCMGKTQMFLRAPVFEYLEQLQMRAITLVAKVVQRRWRFFKEVYTENEVKKPTMRRSRSAVNRIAMVADGFTDKRRRTALRITAAAITIQRTSRVFICANRLYKARFLSIWVSSHYRGYKAREGIRTLRRKMAVSIQKIWRGKLQKSRYIQLKTSVVSVQNWIRRVRFRLLKRREESLRVKAEWSTLKLQSLWRRKSAGRATTSLLIAREEEREAAAALEHQKRQEMMDRLLDKCEKHPGLMEALLETDELTISSIVSNNTDKADKFTSTEDETWRDSAEVVENPLHPVSSTTHQNQLQELKDTITHLQKELEKKKTCCFGFC